MDRQEVLVAVISLLITSCTAITAIVLVLSGIAFSARVIDAEIIVSLFIIAIVLSLFLYRFIPHTASEKRKENNQRLADENQRMLHDMLVEQIESQTRELQRIGIPLVSDMVIQAQSEQEREAPNQIVELTPLPHFQGYILPPRIEVEDLPDGQHRAKMTNVGATSPERGRLEGSQVIDAYWQQGGDIRDFGELIVKFGVIRVKALKGELRNARAEIGVLRKRNGFHDYPIVDKFRNEGYLNWFSLAIKKSILMNTLTLGEIARSKNLGLNKYLRNPIEYVHENETKDLLLFYMMKDVPYVFLCTESEHSIASDIMVGGKEVEFNVVISITADGLPKTDFKFDIRVAAFDEYSIRKVD